jgi:hypothetical protein
MIFPLPIHHLLQQRLQHYHSIGARAIYYESYPNWALDGHKYALMNDLLWNVDMDVDAWLDDFYKTFFGAAAAPMKKYDTLWEEAWLAGKEGERIGPLQDSSYAHITPEMYAKVLRVAYEEVILSVCDPTPVIVGPRIDEQSINEERPGCCEAVVGANEIHPLIGGVELCRRDLVAPSTVGI